MAFLSDLEYEQLQAGMIFKHPTYGEQIILDIARGQFGPIIQFHNCQVFNGEMPELGEAEGELDIFHTLASQIYPYGAEKWEYLGMASNDEIEKRGWGWWQVICPHCGFVHRFLSCSLEDRLRNCRECGMMFRRSSEGI